MNTTTQLFLVLNTLIGGVVIWLVNRRKTSAETKKFETESKKIETEDLEVRVRMAEKLVEVYGKDAATSRKEKEDLIQRLAELQAAHIVEINDINRSCAEQMKDMSMKKDEKIQDLEIENQMLKNQLKKDI